MMNMKEIKRIDCLLIKDNIIDLKVMLETYQNDDFLKNTIKNAIQNLVELTKSLKE